jgi:hypothetical protein
LRNDGFALLKGKVLKLGHIVDISAKGLAFRYLENDGDDALKEAGKLDIHLLDQTRCLENIPFKPVSNTRLNSDPSSGLVPLRRCGVAFGELSMAQHSELLGFLQRFGELPHEI